MDAMINKANSKFSNIEIEVLLNNVKVDLENKTLTLIFYDKGSKSYYNRRYDLDDSKDVVDFNRVMWALGCSQKNYQIWLNKLASYNIPITININSMGKIRFIKSLSKDGTEKVKKAILLDSVEGLDDDMIKFLFENYTLKQLEEELS